MTTKYRPGDKIGFSGNGFESAAINLGSWGLPNLGYYWPPAWCSLSHVGVIGEHEGKLYLFESTTDDDCSMFCAITNRRINGVQAHFIDQRIHEYHGRVWHYPLVTPLYDHQVKRSTQFLLQYLGAGYDVPGAINCGLKSWTYGLRWLHRHTESFNENCLETLFCSELVAAHDSYVGLLQTDRADLWTPNYLIRTERRIPILHKPIRKK